MKIAEIVAGVRDFFRTLVAEPPTDVDLCDRGIVLKSKRADPESVGFAEPCIDGKPHAWAYANEGPLRTCRFVKTVHAVCNEVATCSRCNKKVEM